MFHWIAVGHLPVCRDKGFLTNAPFRHYPLCGGGCVCHANMEPAARGSLRQTYVDMQTFDAAYRQYRDVVLRFAIQCVGRREIAEEITAEAFLELHRRWESIEADKLPSWLFTVVKNRAIDHWRRMEQERRYSLELTPPIEHAPSTPAPSPFDNPALKTVHRLCLTLRYMHEMSLGEIADRLGLKEVQVKGHLQYARTILRKQLS